MIHPLPKGYSMPVRIGAGSFGFVYRVRQDDISKFVVLKYIDEKNPDTRNALKREARLQANLQIPGIPQVYNVLEISGYLCIVMQWIHGCMLKDFLENNIPLEHKYAIAFEAIKIVAALHNANYAHRDLKPENIIISSNGVYLIDFGFSRSTSYEMYKTESDVIKGTPAYMAPELLKISVESTDYMKADVYSLGKIIVKMLGEESSPDCIIKSICDDPDSRPASAIVLLSLWTASMTNNQVNWDEIAEPYASETFSRDLCAAAKILVDMRKLDDAYQLLIECLGINPELSDAIEMIERFPIIKSKQNLRNKSLLVTVLLTLILIVIVTVFFSRKNLIAEPFILLFDTDNDSNSLLMKTTVQVSDFMGSLPFREETQPVCQIEGRIIIDSYPSKGHLLIDGKKRNIDSNVISVEAPFSRHKLEWINENNDITWRESLCALPFEEKRIKIKEK